MAKMRLSDGVTDVDFDPIEGYEVPESRRRTTHKTLDGSLYVYEWGNKRRDEVPVIAIEKTDADQFNEWWQDMTELKYYYDYENNPSSYVTVVIINETQPLQMMTMEWQDKYYGTLILREK